MGKTSGQKKNERGDADVISLYENMFAHCLGMSGMAGGCHSTDVWCHKSTI